MANGTLLCQGCGKISTFSAKKIKSHQFILGLCDYCGRPDKHGKWVGSTDRHWRRLARHGNEPIFEKCLECRTVGGVCRDCRETFCGKVTSSKTDRLVADG